MIIDELKKEIQVKVVYFGPAMSGKTTSLKFLFTSLGKGDEVESIESSTGRTLFYDYGTISFEKDQWKLKLHIYSTTGQDYYIVTRQITLRGMDGIIFVADSKIDTYERNLTSWNELLLYFGDILMKTPLILCFNKQDLPDKIDPVDFLEDIDFDKYEKKDIKYTIALTGQGIQEAFEGILAFILENIEEFSLTPN